MGSISGAGNGQVYMPPTNTTNKVPSQTTQGYQPGQGRPDGGNNLYRGSSIIPESAFVDADVVTVTPDNIGELGGDVLLTPQQTKELYEKGSLQVRRELQTAESNEGFMSITAKLAAAIVGPSRSVAAIQIDPLFMEMIKDPNAKVGMGYTKVQKETWTVLPSGEPSKHELPTMPPKKTDYKAPPVPEYGERVVEPTQPADGETPGPATGQIYRIARTPGEANSNSDIVKKYTDEGFPSLGNGESVADNTYDGSAAEAILGREMQVPFQYVGRASLNFNTATHPVREKGESDSHYQNRIKTTRAFTKQMAEKIGFRCEEKNGKFKVFDREGNLVDGRGIAYKNAVAEAMGLGDFENYQKLQDQVKFTQSVGYIDELNATALYGQVAEQSASTVQKHLGRIFDGKTFDNTQHEYFTASDLKSYPTGDGKTLLDDYKNVTQNTPIPEAYLDEYQKLYNSKTGANLTLDQIKSANPTLIDMYAIHAQTFQPNLGITFSNGKASVPEGSVESVLNARIVLEANTSNGGEDELLYGENSVKILNDRVAQEFGNVTNMKLGVTDKNGNKTTLTKTTDVVKFLQIYDASAESAESIYNDVEADITQRYNQGTEGKDYKTVGNGYIPRAVGGGGGGSVITGPTAATRTAAINDNLTKLNAPGLAESSKEGLLGAINEQIGKLPPEQLNEPILEVNGQKISPQEWLDNVGGIRDQVIAVADQELPQSLHDAIHINMNTAKDGGPYPPGTSTKIAADIKRDIDQLRVQLNASGDKPLMVKSPTGDGEIRITTEYLDQLEKEATDATDVMAFNENKDLNENPQNYTTAEDGSPQLKSGLERGNEGVASVTQYVKDVQQGGGKISTQDQEKLAGTLDSSAQNIFQDLKAKGIVTGNYTPDAISQVSAESVRAKVTDPAEAQAIIDSVEQLKEATALIGGSQDLNAAADVKQGINTLAQKTETETFEKLITAKAFTGELSRVASLGDGELFNAFMEHTYGLPPYNTASAEIKGHYDTLRKAAINETLPAAPSVEFVDASTLNGGNGAYVRDSVTGESTIRVSKDLLNDPEALKNVLTEEMFHHLEHNTEIQAIKKADGRDAETEGDEGHAGLKAMEAILKDVGISAEAVKTAALKGRDQVSSVTSGGRIEMDAVGSDHGRITGTNQTIEFNSTPAAPDTDFVNPNQKDEKEVIQKDPLNIPDRAGVDMPIQARNANPTQRADMSGVDAELFNAAPPTEGTTPPPEGEADGGFKMAQLLEATPGLLKAFGQTLFAKAQMLDELAEKFFKQGVANNLSNASSLMSQAQSLNGYFHARADLTQHKDAPNYSLRPEYGDQTPDNFAKERNQYYNDHNRQTVQRDQQNVQSAEARETRVNDARRESSRF